MIYLDIRYYLLSQDDYLLTVFRGPVLSNNLILPSLISSADSPTRAKQSDLQLPLWVRSAAKLLSGGADGQDWLALAKRLGKSSPMCT